MVEKHPMKIRKCPSDFGYAFSDLSWVSLKHAQVSLNQFFFQNLVRRSIFGLTYQFIFNLQLSKKIESTFSELWNGNLKIYNIYMSVISEDTFPELSNIIFNKIEPYMLYFIMIKLHFFHKPLKNPSILNQSLHFKTPFLCFITSKWAKETRIQGKYHLFHFSLLTLIWFFELKILRCVRKYIFIL